MKEVDYSVIPINREFKPENIVDVIEKEVKKKWDEGWVFISAEPDKLFESVRISFERNLYVE